MHTFNTIVTFNKDDKGRVYVSAKVGESIVACWLNSLEKIINPLDFFAFTLNQQRRDNQTHHVTVIDPLEIPCIDSGELEKFIGYEVRISIFGIGAIKEDGNEVYFLVCESREINKIRKILNLDEADLHITLGFKSHDIFDCPKDKTTLVYPYNIIER